MTPTGAEGIQAVNLRCESVNAPLGVTEPQPRLGWELRANGSKRGQTQTAYRILVASSLKLLGKGKGDLWDTGKVKSSRQNQISYAGKTLGKGQPCHWRVQVWDAQGASTWSNASSWETSSMDLKSPLWLTDGRPVPAEDAAFYKDDPAPLFRREFSTTQPVVRARLSIVGLGYYEVTVNGTKVGDQVLEPGWTRFDKRVGIREYDVTEHVVQGKNCFGVQLGSGWYNPLPLKLFGSFDLRKSLPVGRPRFIAQLKIVFRDGTTQTVKSDQDWRVGESGIRRNNIYLGEIVDARLEPIGWNKPGFNVASWRKPAVASGPVGPLLAPPQPPIRITARWKATRVTQPQPGVFIYDMGVNFAGWVSLKFNASEGTKIGLRYGELLHKDGTLNPMTSVAGQIKGNRQGTSESVGGPGAPSVAWQADTYIARGGGETYTPKFTFHGFRYVEITGLTASLPLSAVEAQRLNTDVENAGDFSCSDDTLNQIQAICRRTFLSNIFSVQSDCPHRERLAYGGDIVATAEAFCANFDMAGFYAKTVQDWSDSALPDGMFTDTAPFIGIQYCGVAWAMAHPVLLETLLRHYGDRQIAEREYAAAKRWLQLTELRYPSGIVTDGLSDHESLDPTPSDALVTPMYYRSASLLSKVAARLGKAEDASQFARLATNIKRAYAGKFIDPATGKIGPGTQSSQAIALGSGIVPDNASPAAFDFMVGLLEGNGKKIRTGILGTKYLLEVLTRRGRADLAYEVVRQPEFPGWVWMMRNGATTLWEHWAFSDNTFSHNHPMFGSVSHWMMAWLGGIQPAEDADGFDRVLIRPQTPSGLDWVKSSHRSVRGDLVSNWSRNKDGLVFEISVPVNVQAAVRLPGLPSRISEGPTSLSRVVGVRQVRVIGKETEFRLGSGTYKFRTSRL